jgi:hypothetical protein
LLPLPLSIAPLYLRVTATTTFALLLVAGVYRTPEDVNMKSAECPAVKLSGGAAI